MPGMPVRAGQVIAHRYRVEELLGAGDSGMVVAAKHVWLRSSVALKILAAYTDGQLASVQRQIARARVAMRLSSPHIAKIKDIGLTQDKMPYIATERLEGRSLAAELAEKGKLEVAEAVRWILQACAGLAEAHAIDLVHGDLRPSNLFLAEGRDGERTLKVLDFGMRGAIEGDAGTATWLASPAYLAPEQIQDPTAIDAQADVWALGVILYELLAGKRPFSGETVSGMLVAVVMEEPPLLTDAPYELARLVQRCLSKSPSERPATVAELARELAPFASSEDAVIAEQASEALASPPPEEPALDDEVEEPTAYDPEESLAPVSTNTPLPLPLVKRRGAFTKWDPTAPSTRILAGRRSRARRIAFGAIALATGIAMAGTYTYFDDMPATASSTVAAPAPEVKLDDTNDEPYLAPRDDFEPTAFVPPTMIERDPAEATPAMPAMPIVPVDQLPLSPAPPVEPAQTETSSQPTTMTPPRPSTPASLTTALVMRPHNLNTQSSSGGVVAPKRERATETFRLPAGLPTTRSGVATPLASTPSKDRYPSPSRSLSSSPALPAHPRDESYLRNLGPRK